MPTGRQAPSGCHQWAHARLARRTSRRKIRDPLDEVTIELEQAWLGVMQVHRTVHFQVGHTPRLVTGIDPESALRTAKQQSGTDQENEASGHLAGNEQSAKMRAAQPLAERAAFLFEGGIHIGLRGLESRSEAKRDSSRARYKQRVNENGQIGADFESDGAPERR